MHSESKNTYPPLHTLKPVANDVWIVDGPAIRFGMSWPKMPFPTRMTVVRLTDGLFLHSPTPLAEELRTEITALGPPCWIVGPNRIHYWWVPDWHAAFPEAEVYLAPYIEEQAAGRIDFDSRALHSGGGYPWDGEIETLPVKGRYMTEVAFFHRSSRTLILTDLVENFERDKLGSPFMRWLTRWAGALDPNGGMPRDMRMTYPKETLRAAVERMIDWNPERIILAHGRWYVREGAAELKRAFRWLLR